MQYICSKTGNEGTIFIICSKTEDEGSILYATRERMKAVYYMQQQQQHATIITCVTPRDVGRGYACCYCCMPSSPVLQGRRQLLKLGGYIANF